MYWLIQTDWADLKQIVGVAGLASQSVVLAGLDCGSIEFLVEGVTTEGEGSLAGDLVEEDLRRRQQARVLHHLRSDHEGTGLGYMGVGVQAGEPVVTASTGIAGMFMGVEKAPRDLVDRVGAQTPSK